MSDLIVPGQDSNAAVLSTSAIIVSVTDIGVGYQLETDLGNAQSVLGYQIESNIPGISLTIFTSFRFIF